MGDVRRFVLMASVLFLAASARAGDCSDPSDCQSIPDNATKAGIGIAIGTGGALAARKKKKAKETGGGEATGEDSLFGPGER